MRRRNLPEVRHCASGELTVLDLVLLLVAWWRRYRKIRRKRGRNKGGR